MRPSTTLVFSGPLRIERNSEFGMEIRVGDKDLGEAITNTFMVEGEVKYVADLAQFVVTIWGEEAP